MRDIEPTYSRDAFTDSFILVVVNIVGAVALGRVLFLPLLLLTILKVILAFSTTDSSSSHGLVVVRPWVANHVHLWLEM